MESRGVNTMLIICICSIASAFASEASNSKYPYHAQLDTAGQYQLFWNFNEDTITFQFHAATKGWAALGFSPNGGMAGADIALIWIDQSGKGQISDRHSPENGFPPEDAHQDYTLIECTKNDTHLIATFSRKRSTCDTNDWTFRKTDTTRVIYASNDEIPQSKDQFRKHTIRGSKSVHFFDQKFGTGEGAPPEPDAKPLDIKVTKVRIPEDQDTMYWCEVIKLPKISKKVHIIKSEPSIEPQNTDVVHHILAYVCSKDMKHIVGKGRPCFDQDGRETPDFNSCRENLLAGWAVGGQSQTYPPDIGRPLYTDAGDMYVMMEMHYDNAQFKKGKVDSSGLRVWTTEHMRPIESGGVVFGIPVGADEQVIPPGVAEFTNYGYCSAACTKNFPKDGIKITNGIPHTHLAGRKVRLLHFRNGKQLPHIIADEYYDFNYQDNRQLAEPVTVLPGDDLVVECVYETKNRNKTTFSGEGTRDEMCFVFMEYYPASFRGFLCLSTPIKRQQYASFGINFAPYNPANGGERVIMPDGKEKSLGKFLKDDYKFDWTPQKIMDFQNVVRNTSHTVICIREEGDKPLNFTPNANGTIEGVNFYPQNGYPIVTEPLVISDGCVQKNEVNGRPKAHALVEMGGAGLNKFSTLIIIVMTGVAIFMS